jgi:aspartyl protease family protein
MSSGRTLFWAGAIVASAVLIAPGLQRVDTPRAVAGPAVETPAPQPEMQVGNGYVSQELVRNPDGHFYAEAQVNGAQIRFMIDTGATIVALTREDAQRAGIQFGSDRAMVRGVGGPVEVIPVTIDRLAIGSLTATQVEAAVADDLGVSLLGQSFLSRVGTVEIQGDRMVLR